MSKYLNFTANINHFESICVIRAKSKSKVGLFCLHALINVEVMETCLRIHIINVFGLIGPISVDIETQDTSNVFSM